MNFTNMKQLAYQKLAGEITRAEFVRRYRELQSQGQHVHGFANKSGTFLSFRNRLGKIEDRGGVKIIAWLEPNLQRVLVAEDVKNFVDIVNFYANKRGLSC